MGWPVACCESPCDPALFRRCRALALTLPSGRTLKGFPLPHRLDIEFGTFCRRFRTARGAAGLEFHFMVPQV